MGFSDPVAAALVERLDADTSTFLADRPTMRGGILRSIWFDRVVADFLARHPDGLCVNLGAGLDDRARRIGIARYPDADWVDVDRAEVVALRDALIEPQARVMPLSGDLSRADWIDTLPWPAGRAALFGAEGVMMYLQPAGAEHLIRGLCAGARDRDAMLTLAFDFASPLMVRHSRRHPSVGKTRARFHWGLRRPSDIEAMEPELVCVERADVMSRCGLGAAVFFALHRLVTFGRFFYGCLRFERRASAGETAS